MASASRSARSPHALGAGAASRVAYPGLWLRDDVYAIHGHYLDRHLTVPTIERLGAGLMRRLAGEPPAARGRAEDYEAVLGADVRLARRGRPARRAGASGDGSFQVAALARRWRRERGAAPARARSRVDGAAAVPGRRRRAQPRRLGPLRADISGPSCAAPACAAIGEVLARLGLRADARHLRPHPPRRPAARRRPAASGAPRDRLLNTGSWVHEPGFLGAAPGRSPYRPGFAVTVDDDGPPELVNLLPVPARQARREADGVAADARAELELELAGGAARVRDQLVAPGWSTAMRRGRWRVTVPLPSSTAHTPPAS